MNWKEKATELLNEHLLESYKRDVIQDTNTTMEEAVVKAMLDFAKLACEEQKKICSEIADIEWVFDGYKDCPEPNKDEIRNAPTVKFD